MKYRYRDSLKERKGKAVAGEKKDVKESAVQSVGTPLKLAPWVRSVYKSVGMQIEGFYLGLEDRAA